MASSPSPNEVVTLRIQGRIAIITLNNPKKLGAMRLADYHRLSSVMRDVAAMPNVTITILTGTGKFFSAGADVTTTRPGADGNPHEAREAILRGFVANNIDITRSFYTHPKVLVVALNGPTVGLSAALLGFADFIYAAPHAFFLTPFTSLGLVAEGGASVGLVQRMGLSTANQALLMSRKIEIDQLVSCGFVNKVFEAPGGKDDSDGFLKLVIEEVEDKLGEHLNQESVVLIKQMIRRPYLDMLEAQGVREVIGGMERFISGAPQAEFAKMSSGQKRHKL